MDQSRSPRNRGRALLFGSAMGIQQISNQERGLLQAVIFNSFSMPWKNPGMEAWEGPAGVPVQLV